MEDDDLSLNIPDKQRGDMPDNDPNSDSAVYAELGLEGQPDSMNPGSEEATDTILYTDNAVATDMTDMVYDTDLTDPDGLTDSTDLDELTDARMQAEVDQLAKKAD